MFLHKLDKIKPEKNSSYKLTIPKRVTQIYQL